MRRKRFTETQIVNGTVASWIFQLMVDKKRWAQLSRAFILPRLKPSIRFLTFFKGFLSLRLMSGVPPLGQLQIGWIQHP